MIPLELAIWQHLVLVYSGFFISAGIGIIGGVLTVRWHILKTLLLSGSSLLQSIPAFTIVALVVPFLGIGFVPAVVVVIVTTLLPVLRNTSIGLSTISPVYIDASEGMGFTFFQTMRYTRFPLAIRPIFAGLRLSSIVANSVAIVTVFIGSGGLGAVVLEGLVRYHTTSILTGIIPAMIIALGADILLSKAEERLAPKI